jgi:hypothetical protein
MTVIRQPREPAPIAYPTSGGPDNIIAWWITADSDLLNGSRITEPFTSLTSGVQSFALVYDGGPADSPFCAVSTEGYKYLGVYGPGGGSQPIDSNVAGFQLMYYDPADPVNCIFYILGNDGNLWIETNPTLRPGGIWEGSKIAHVDGNVVSFQGIDTDHAFVLGSDGNLWYAYSDWQYPEDRDLVASGVWSFQAVTQSNEPAGISVYVLYHQSGELAVLNGPADGGAWGPGTTVAVPVSSFAPLNLERADSVYWVSNTAQLWLRTLNGNGEWVNGEGGGPDFVPIDENVSAIACNSGDYQGLLVLGSDGNLWYEYVDGSAPRYQVASDVRVPRLVVAP